MLNNTKFCACHLGTIALETANHFSLELVWLAFSVGICWEKTVWDCLHSWCWQRSSNIMPLPDSPLSGANHSSRWQHRHNLIKNSAVLLTATLNFCFLLMLTDSTNAKWDSEEEIRSLMDFLHTHCSGAGDGGNFTETTFRATAVHICPLLKSEPVKTSAMVKKKFKVVRSYSDLIWSYTDLNDHSTRPYINRSSTIVTDDQGQCTWCKHSGADGWTGMEQAT